MRGEYEGASVCSLFLRQHGARLNRNRCPPWEPSFFLQGSPLPSPPSPLHSQLPRMEAQHQQQLAKLKADVTRWKEVAKAAEEAGAAREAEVCVVCVGGGQRRQGQPGRQRYVWGGRGGSTQ